ncbi:hypothetical protein PR048_023782 [Dryococelus australis]|uniref:Uncharacterized protein n=1 Tax=Dryococelus australis TaxID=614101 RepID=A0ABQ9GV01_9NEOP|nr:hypothetical protein PR048_023782 [Dryococelus australis]
MERRRNEGAGKTGEPRENPLTNIFRERFPHAKIRSDPAGDWTRISLVGGEQANSSATVALHVSMEQRRDEKEREKREIPEKTYRPAASSGTIPPMRKSGNDPAVD